MSKCDKRKKEEVEQGRRRGKFWLAREVDPLKLDGYTVIFHLDRERKSLIRVEVTTEEIAAVCLPKSHKVCKEDAFSLFHHIEDALVDCVCRGTSVKSLDDLNKAAAVVADAWQDSHPDRPLAAQDPSKAAEEIPPLYDPPVLREPKAGMKSLEFSWFLPGKPGQEYEITGFELQLFCFDFETNSADAVSKVQVGNTIRVEEWKRSYKFDNLRASRQHWCRVRAVGDKGWEGEWSSETPGKTQSTVRKAMPSRTDALKRVQESIREAKAMQEARKFAREQMIARGLCHGDPVNAPDLAHSPGESRSPTRSPVRVRPGAQDAAPATPDRVLVENEQGAEIFTLTDMLNNSVPQPSEYSSSIQTIARARRSTRDSSGLPPRPPSDGTSRPSYQGGYSSMSPPYDARRFEEDTRTLNSRFWRDPDSPRRHSIAVVQHPRKC